MSTILSRTLRFSLKAILFVLVALYITLGVGCLLTGNPAPRIDFLMRKTAR